MSLREKPTRRQFPKPGKGASPAEIKAWIEKCQAQSTPEELAEYDKTGEDLKSIFKQIGFDPASGTFGNRSHNSEVDSNPNPERT